MISLTNFISIDQTLQGAFIKSKKRVFETLSQLLENTSTENATSSHIYQSLYARERIGSTAIGRGVVIPHCRSDRVKMTQIALLTLSDAIDYDSPDEQPVDVFVGLIFPENIKNVHLQFLSHLAGLFKDEAYCARIRQAKDNESLYQAFISEVNIESHLVKQN